MNTGMIEKASYPKPKQGVKIPETVLHCNIPVYQMVVGIPKCQGFVADVL